MKNIALAVTLALGLTACAQELAVPAAPFDLTGFMTPESVRYDSASDLYLVANINGAPLDKDNNGYISQISPDGKTVNARFIAGGANGVTLNAPKGTAIVGDTLYVSDIDTVRSFDRKTGAVKGNVAIAGATFLNDLAAAPDGSVYVSDSGLDATFASNGADAVYKISPAGAVTKIVSGVTLNRPNGLAVLSSGKVQVVPFGSNEIYTVTDAGVVGYRKTLPGGQLDGVEVYNGGLLVSSWETSSVYFVPASGAVTTVASGVKSPADIGLDSRRGRVLIPLFMDNTVRVVSAK